MAVETNLDFIESYDVWYGSIPIPFTVIRRHRKTLEIAVLPDSRVVVSAPVDSAEEDIREKVKKRASWVVKQQKWFKQFGPRTPVRQYLGGETHLYLGKSYRLKIASSVTNNIRLLGAYFEVAIKGEIHTETIKKQFDGWYRKQAIIQFQTIFSELCKKYKIAEPPTLQIKTMKTRWGSLSKGGIMTLNISLVRAPKECIRYVITHELCHMAHHDHSPEFYKLLTTRLPNWKNQKQKLEEALI